MAGRSASGPFRLDEGQVLDLQRDQLDELDDAVGDDVRGGGFTGGGRSRLGFGGRRGSGFLAHGFRDEGGDGRFRDGDGSGRGLFDDGGRQRLGLLHHGGRSEGDGRL